MELLRLVCMLMIVCHHFTQAIWLYVPDFAHHAYVERAMIDLLNAFCLVAVNVFVLISGFFGIRPSWRGAANLYLQCAFYAGLLYFVYILINGIGINRWCLYNAIMPISHNPGWWFIPCYVFLYILSPILNRSIDGMSKGEYQIALILLTILNCYFGFFRRFDFNVTGYSLSHFIYLYFIGRYLKLHFVWSINKNVRCVIYALGYMLGSVTLWGLGQMAGGQYNNIVCWTWEQYNHPLMLFNSICLLLLFTEWHFQNKIVNWFATSTLAVYLLHRSVYFNECMDKIVANIYTTPPYLVLRIATVLLSAICLLLICLLVDKIRILLINPIISKIHK